jgi:hypothetical protein
MAESVWRRRAPLWLRIVAGILILPLLGLILVVATRAFGLDTPLFWLVPIAAALAWLIAYRAPVPIAAALSVLAVLGFALPFYLGSEAERTFEGISGHLDRVPSTESEAEASPPEPTEPDFAQGETPRDEVPSSDGHHYEIPFDELASPLEAPQSDGQAAQLGPEAPGPDLAAPSGGGGGGGSAAQSAMPEFPWPPPAASASYVLPDRLFDGYRTLGDVTKAILEALEQNGYVERSFFRTDPGGVALVTRLERINDDGSPSVERWPAGGQRQDSTRGLLDFLQGLFFVDPGHYRVIVFVFQDVPFSQSAENITAEQAHAWLTSGLNVLSPQIAQRPFAGGHVTVLIYEFASDGSKVQVVTSQLTGKQHLEKAGLLTALDKEP